MIVYNSQVVETETKRGARIIAFGAGKGGVGKTVMSANIALMLAAKGHKVLVVDADLGGANLHSVLGVAPPKRGLSDLMRSGVEIDDVVSATPYPRLSFISGAFDDVYAANPAHQQKMKVLRQLNAYNSDYVIMDLGAGTSLNTLDFFLLSDLGALVVLPEPTSVENAYRFLKAAFIRRLRSVGHAFGLQPIIEEAKRNRNALGIKTPADLIRAIKHVDPVIGKSVEEQMRAFVPRLILNQVRTDGTFDDRLVAEDMASGCRRFFGIDLRIIGSVPRDDSVSMAVRAREPIAISYPSSPAGLAIAAIANRLVSVELAEEKAA